MSRTEPVGANLIYKQISGLWPFEPPLYVQIHSHFCLCPRRHKWSPNAIVASVEYRWPQIQVAFGFNKPIQCHDIYFKFFKDHYTHQDPLCFRATIFYAALIDWCPRWNFAINVNYYHESRQEFLMLLKLQYRPSRRVRLVRAIALTYFIEGVHTSLINEFPYTQA